MKRNIGACIVLSLGLLSANVALAGNTALGALLGGSVGAIVGQQIGGHDGTLIGGAVGAVAGAIIASENDDHRHRRYDYAPSYPSRVVHAPAPAYRSAPVRYTPPARVVRQPVYVSSPAKARQNQGYGHYDQGRNLHRR